MTWKWVQTGVILKLIKSESPEFTRQWAAEFARTSIQCGDLVLLRGEMGAGKTTLVSGLADGLEIKDQTASPTFNKLNIYRGDLVLYHLDFYNVKCVEELEDLGIYDYLEPEDGVCVVEWWHKFPEVVPQNAHRIEIQMDSEHRVLKFESKG